MRLITIKFAQAAKHVLLFRAQCLFLRVQHRHEFADSTHHAERPVSSVCADLSVSSRLNP